jgi:hypothetical protein
MKLYQSLSFAIIVVIALSSLGSDCSQESADSSMVNAQQKVYATTQPIPQFTWSQDRDNLIQIYKMKNEARNTYAVVRSTNSGEILWHCPSVGFPLPADTQLTNPLQQVYQAAVIEQAEPNGLFSSKSTDGTYVICVSADGTVSPQYTESKVDVFTRPVKIENGKVVFIDGPPSMVMVKHVVTP